MTKPPPGPPTSGPERKGGADLASVLAALEDRRSGVDDRARRRRSRARRRGALTVSMLVLLGAGVIASFTLSPDVRPAAEGGSRTSVVYGNARSGTCLGWPPDAPDKPSFVQCRSDHVFEVARPLGANATDEQCRAAVREYLGPHYDPNGKFTVKVLAAGTGDVGDGGDRNTLCGLQLTGPEGTPVPFKGRIVDLDQSKVWAPGTCLGIDSSNRSTDGPVGCTTPHALEVTGTVSLATRFGGAVPPSDPDQRTFLTEACTRTADAYLAPATVGRKRLALGFQTVSPASWTAGSRQVSCSVGRTTERGWTAVTGSVRNASPADLTPPPAPPQPVAPAAPPPPPVYEEPLVPVPTVAPTGPPPGPAPGASPGASPGAPPTDGPPPGASPTTRSDAPTATDAPGLPAGTGPAPGPATPPSDDGAAPPGIVELPGLPPIILPGYVPPVPPDDPAAPQP